MMDESGSLPFKVGQLAESRSFVSGFRGAWFRCKIKNIGLRKKEMMHALEFYDFPDEKVRWTKLYQRPVGGSKSKEMKRQLMVRPSFPPIYCESQMPDVNDITDVVVIVRDVWVVGDLVDWWTDNCYWSARVTEILGDGKARIKLPSPPVGEGSSYEVSYNDLRPTLEWSPDDGWIVPISEERDCCARLIKPVNQEGAQNLTICPTEKVREDAQPTAGASVEYNASFSSRMSTSTLPPLERHAKRPLSPDVADAGIGKSSYSDSVSTSHIRDATAETPGTDAGKRTNENSESSKKMRNDGSIPLHSLCSDTIEAAILDYEELINRVKWIKGILQLGTIPSNTKQPRWKFLEHRSSSFPK
ncbi:Agenet domain protein [Melia azedarach]|uniref:Agenet domain protein n=1 Tax=Melia azedarach TaxID=155640 RepID=A0ACC1YGU7_MELAZ|nr:Agenet domain protein [Melia azedarach]